MNLPGVSAEESRCVRIKRNGERCRNQGIPGGTVCKKHGGKAPQIEQAARLRLAAFVAPALLVYEQLLRPRHRTRIDKEFIAFMALRQKTAKDVLDRNGFKAKEEVVLTTKFDEERFAHLSDDQLKQMISLARLITTQTDATDH